MNNKKKMVLGAAFVVAIMALAGIGYAAVTGQFKAQTSSDTQTADVDYVVIALNNTNDYTAHVLPITTALYWNTETDASGTEYTVVNPGYVDYTYRVNITKTALEDNDKLKLTVSGLTVTGDDYTIKCLYNAVEQTITDGSVVIFDDTAASSVAAYYEITVRLTPAESPTDEAPATTAVFPALTFILAGDNGAAE